MGLQDKIIAYFEGRVVRKDLSKNVKGNAVVPTYVLEYLLGQHCASFDDEIIEYGLEKVKSIITHHFVHRDEAEVIKHKIRDQETYKIIDKVSVRLNDKKDIYEASFSNLGLNKVYIDDMVIKNHPKLLSTGVWCLVNVGYYASDDGEGPWTIESLKPIQISSIDVSDYKDLRKNFTTEEWIDLLMQSIGLNPEYFSTRGKLIQLTRLIPFCENNYNYIELGPKGTGKSHVFSELSPHGILLSGGDVTQAKLFVNNASGQIGLVGYWDTVAFDEFAGKKKRVDKKLVDIMKNYMANKSFSRGRDVYGATASMVFIGNTDHSVAYMLRHSHLFESLPQSYVDTAFLDRLHIYVPGWEVKKLRREVFTDGYGFIVDYLAEVLRETRNEFHAGLYKSYFEIGAGLTTRDINAIEKTFSGLIKLIYPNADCSKEEMQPLLEFAMEGRKRVKDQLVIMDATFEDVEFSYTDLQSGEKHVIETLEILEQNYSEKKEAEEEILEGSQETKAEVDLVSLYHGKHVKVFENQKGISYHQLFAPVLKGAQYLHLHDPYIRTFYQVKNLAEFCRMLLELKKPGEDLQLNVYTKHDEYDDEKAVKTKQYLEMLAQSLENTELRFFYEFDQSQSFHARSIETDTGWKISLDRGLDIFLPYDTRNLLNIENLAQTARACKDFELTYLWVKDSEIS